MRHPAWFFKAANDSANPRPDGLMDLFLIIYAPFSSPLAEFEIRANFFGCIVFRK
jgi:hypothetical protein